MMKHIAPISKGAELPPQEILAFIIELIAVLEPIITLIAESKEAETPEAEARAG